MKNKPLALDSKESSWFSKWTNPACRHKWSQPIQMCVWVTGSLFLEPTKSRNENLNRRKKRSSKGAHKKLSCRTSPQDCGHQRHLHCHGFNNHCAWCLSLFFFARFCSYTLWRRCSCCAPNDCWEKQGWKSISAQVYEWDASEHAGMFDPWTACTKIVSLAGGLSS